MKKLIALVIGLAALFAGITLNATNPIEAYAGPNRVLVISAGAAFGADHVVRPYTGLTLTKHGLPYQPEGGKWFRLIRPDGTMFDEAESNRTILRTEPIGLDGAIITPWRMLPHEAVEQLASVAVGDRVKVFSRRTGTTADGRVTALNPAKWTIATDYPAESGDSGSLVTTPDGIAVGFVSTAIGTPSTGSQISVPPISPTWTRGTIVAGQTDQTPTVAVPENVPVVVTNVPAPVLPVVTAEQAYQRGVVDGRKQALTSLQKDLEGVLQRVKAAL